ncbi:DUF3570 domain-containing protein [Gilvimarinus algae]
MAATKRVIFALAALALMTVARAEVLAPDRLDVMYHSYDGGGATIDGPSILVRKNIGTNVAVSANYYVDMVSSASIDVLATASEYSEERTEYSVGTEFLHDRTIIRAGYTSSDENDYQAQTGSVSISQAFFGDLTTLTFGVSYGEDVVGQNGNPEFEEEVRRRRYQVNLSQILTKSLIAAVNVESAVDEGFLNNPYRQVRYLDPNAAQGYSYQREIYPETRNSDAASLRAIYYLPYRASLRADYRYYEDSWGIEADNWELRYTHPWGQRWLFELKYRNYQQSAADFYSDLFPYRDAQNFMARDKELSDYTSDNIGLGITYNVPEKWLWVFEKSTVNLYWDHFQFDYQSFRNVLDTEAAPGEEPFYNFDANVIRFYFSFWY